MAVFDELRNMPWTTEQRKSYGPRWKTISHAIRFKRAHGRCEHCGAINGQRFLFSRGEIRLSACHRNHTPGDNRATNLAAWCQKCHLTYDRADNLRRARLTRCTRKDQQRPLLNLEEPT